MSRAIWLKTEAFRLETLVFNTNTSRLTLKVKAAPLRFSIFGIFLSFFEYTRISVSTNNHSKRVLRAKALLRTIHVKEQRKSHV